MAGDWGGAGMCIPVCVGSHDVVRDTLDPSSKTSAPQYIPCHIPFSSHLHVPDPTSLIPYIALWAPAPCPQCFFYKLASMTMQRTHLLLVALKPETRYAAAHI